MEVDRILRTLERHGVEFLLIGGMNFMLRHQGPMTLDVDVWINDTAENLARCEAALSELDAEWGESDNDWRRVSTRGTGWLSRRGVYCLYSPSGSIDVFRSVTGLPGWRECRDRAVGVRLSGGGECWGLCDVDLLACQTALPEGQQRLDRIRTLRAALGDSP